MIIHEKLTYSVINIKDFIIIHHFLYKKLVLIFLCLLVFIIYNEVGISSLFCFEAKQSRTRKTFAKSVFKVYVVINFQICTNICVGYTVHEIPCVCFRSTIKNKITFNWFKKICLSPLKSISLVSNPQKINSLMLKKAIIEGYSHRS